MKKKNPFEGLTDGIEESVIPEVKCETSPCDCEEYAEKIESMFDGTRYAFAFDTLESMYEYWQEHDHLTLKQKTAIDNIAGE